MNQKISSGIFLILIIPLLIIGADKGKKAYELIYKDIQLLKQKIIHLELNIKANSEDIKAIKAQLDEILNITKFLQQQQANFQQSQKSIPDQYQVLIEKIETMNSQLAKFADDLLEVKQVSLQQLEQKEPQPEESPPPEQSKETAAKENKQPPPTPILPPTISPQEVYNTAYSDYLKGNFQLAIEGFSLYRQQFPESPLADNALYWIGECYFSQKKFREAIDQFNELILNYPHGDKVAAAYLKKGISLVELGKKDEALAVFKLLISKYPLEEETKIAQQKIKELIS
ncbi:MAG: tol-pal system protein YbgF [Candidatus Aminicenantales bacterium]